MNRWTDNWDCISPMFKFSQSARRVMYTTNAIESLNSGFRRQNRTRTVFPHAVGLTKALYLATWELTKKWTLTVRNWGQVYAELAIMDPGRLNGDQPSGGRRLSVRSTPALTERRENAIQKAPHC